MENMRQRIRSKEENHQRVALKQREWPSHQA
jgi:hypothetical protein